MFCKSPLYPKYRNKKLFAPGYRWAISVFAIWSDVTHASPDVRTFAIPAALKITAITIHMNRIGQKYPPSSAGGALPNFRRITASAEYASPGRDANIASIPQTKIASPCPTLPKLFGTASTYTPTTNATPTITRVNSPTHDNSMLAARHTHCSANSTACDGAGNCSTSRIHTG